MHPIFLQVGPLAIRYYSLMIIMGVIAATLFAQREARRRGWDPDMLIDYALYVVIGGILGSRIYYVIFQWPQYREHLAEIPKIWHGGLAIHGGWLAGLLVTYFFARTKNLSFWEMADVMAPLLLLGQAFGRIGNLMNGDAHGIPTQLPWGIRFPANTAAFFDTSIPKDPILRDHTVPLHPTMIYENLWNITGFLILWAVRKKPWPTGTHFALTLVWSGIGRAIIESFRGDSLMLGNLKMAQFIGILMVTVAIGIILYRLEEERRHPGATVQSRPLASEAPAAGVSAAATAAEPMHSEEQEGTDT